MQVRFDWPLHGSVPNGASVSLRHEYSHYAIMRTGKPWILLGHLRNELSQGARLRWNESARTARYPYHVHVETMDLVVAGDPPDIPTTDISSPRC